MTSPAVVLVASSHRRDYRPGWLDNLADEVTRHDAAEALHEVTGAR